MDRAKARVADLDRQLAGLQFACGEKDRLDTDLAAAQSHLAAAQASAGDEDKLSAELATAQQRVADIQKQLADRDSELAGFRGDLSAEMAKLKEAQRRLIRALKPQIDKKNIAVELNNERLLINLASGYLFG